MGNGPGRINISYPGSLPEDKGTSCSSQQVGSRKWGGMDSRNLAPQRPLRSHCSGLNWGPLLLAAPSGLNWSQGLLPDTDKHRSARISPVTSPPSQALPCSSTLHDFSVPLHRAWCSKLTTHGQLPGSPHYLLLLSTLFHPIWNQQLL